MGETTESLWVEFSREEAKCALFALEEARGEPSPYIAPVTNTVHKCAEARLRAALRSPQPPNRAEEIARQLRELEDRVRHRAKEAVIGREQFWADVDTLDKAARFLEGKSDD